jgi:PAS domain S-box-containing protein
MIGLHDRIRTESRELAKAHEELKTLFRNMESVFFTVDITQSRVTQMSPSCEKLYGYAAEDFLSVSTLWFDVVLEEDRHIIHANYPVMNAGKSFSQRYRITAKDGTVRWVESKITPTLDESGTLIRIDGVSIDITAQKAAEMERQAIETRFRKLIEKSHDGISLLGSNGRLLYVSPSVEHILGYSMAELIDTDPVEYTHPEDKEWLIPQLMELFGRFGESIRAVYRMKNKSGEWRWLSSTITNLLAEKSVNALVFNYQDITEHKRAQEQIEYDRRNRDALINSTTDLMWSFDANANLIAANRAFISAIERASGKELRTGDKLLALDILPSATRDKWELLYSRVLAGESFTFENHEALPLDQWGELSFNPIVEDGKVIGGSCCWRDITEKKKQLEQLEASERLMADAQRIARFGSWEVPFDEDGKLISDSLTWTDEMYRIFGVERETYTPRAEDTTLGIHPADIELVADWFAAVKQGDGPGSIDYRIDTPHGQRRWIKTTADLIRDKKTGARAKLVGTVQDITERKTLERERHQITKDLVQRNKALEQFAHIVSHNLRAPVANILGLSNLIQLSHNSADTQRQCIDGLTLSAKRLDEIILDLNKILQVKQGMSEEKDVVELETLVSNIKDSIHMIIQQENVSIITDFKEVENLYTIKNYLHSIFFNLISNSIKYRRHAVRPVIEVSSRAEGGKTILTFKDNCMGIDLEKHGHNLFGLYKRFHHNVEGKGMGMYMVKTQVESLGGKISVKSKVDHGTEITIEIGGQR